MKRALLTIVTVCFFAAVTVAGETATGPAPTITSVTPNTGFPGQIITINGTNFDGVTPSANSVTFFGGAPGSIITATAGQLRVGVPSGASTGPITVTVAGQSATSPLDFTVLPPVVTSFNPTFGGPGTPVTITGANFDAFFTASNVVLFNGTPTIVTSANNTTIDTIVPAGATTGPISVTHNGITGTSTTDFIVPGPPPVFIGFNPGTGLAGTQVVITGTNFEPNPANNTLSFNGTTAVITAATTTSLTTSVPVGATTGPLFLTVAGQTISTGSVFVVMLSPPPPTITGYNPLSGLVGTQVIITGTNFDPNPANSTASFNGTAAVITAATTTSLTTSVPVGATTGLISVTVAGQTLSTSSDFVVTAPPPAPTITSFNPTSGPVGTTVTITGNHFNALPANNTVKFNGTTVVVTAAAFTSLTTTVPAGATTGPISVTVVGQTITSATNFTVTAPTGSDITPPVVDVAHPDITAIGNIPVTISVSLSDAESGISNAVLFYRYVSSDRDFTQLQMNHTTGNTYSATIPTSTSNELGFEYKFGVTNGVGLTNAETLYRARMLIAGDGLAIPYTSAGSDVSNYRIVSIPLDVPLNSLGNVFDELGAVDNAKWRMWHYENGQNSELNLSSSIVPGSGYWLISKTDPGTISSGGGATVAASLDAPFQIALKAGWNQVGNPYNFILNWADVQAANAGLPGLRTYIDTFVDATRLDKMEGGFVHVAADRTITIPVLKDKSLNGGRVAAEKVDENPIDQKNWQVHLHLTHGIMRNEIGGFGMNEKASDGLDVYDGVTTPRFFGKWLEINHAQRGTTHTLSKAIVPTREEHVWEFEIETSESDPTMTLSWNNSYFGNDDHQLVLLDNDRHYPVDMRMANSYVFEAGTSKSFKVIFGPALFVHNLTSAKDFALRSVSPNPSGKNGEVIISLSVPDTDVASPVVIEVFDALGKKTWAFEDSLSPGENSVNWKLNGEQAEGLYIVKVRHGSSTVFSRLILRGK